MFSGAVATPQQLRAYLEAFSREQLSPQAQGQADSGQAYTAAGAYGYADQGKAEG